MNRSRGGGVGGGTREFVTHNRVQIYTGALTCRRNTTCMYGGDRFMTWNGVKSTHTRYIASKEPKKLTSRGAVPGVTHNPVKSRNHVFNGGCNLRQLQGLVFIPEPFRHLILTLTLRQKIEYQQVVQQPKACFYSTKTNYQQT